jgi:transcriptional regulator with XRE-family HTH domain
MATWSKEVFAKNLRRYMEAKDISQKELAVIVGVSAPTINEWTKAKKYPRIDKIEILSEYFGCLKSDLIEEKTAEQIKMQETNDSLSDIIIALRTDNELFEIVENLTKLDSEKRAAIKSLMSAFSNK